MVKKAVKKEKKQIKKQDKKHHKKPQKKQVHKKKVFELPKHSAVKKHPFDGVRIPTTSRHFAATDNKRVVPRVEGGSALTSVARDVSKSGVAARTKNKVPRQYTGPKNTVATPFTGHRYVTDPKFNSGDRQRDAAMRVADKWSKMTEEQKQAEFAAEDAAYNKSRLGDMFKGAGKAALATSEILSTFGGAYGLAYKAALAAARKKGLIGQDTYFSDLAKGSGGQNVDVNGEKIGSGLKTGLDILNFFGGFQ